MFLDFKTQKYAVWHFVETIPTSVFRNTCQVGADVDVELFLFLEDPRKSEDEKSCSDKVSQKTQRFKKEKNLIEITKLLSFDRRRETKAPFVND